MSFRVLKIGTLKYNYIYFYTMYLSKKLANIINIKPNITSTYRLIILWCMLITYLHFLFYSFFIFSHSLTIVSTYDHSHLMTPYWPLFLDILFYSRHFLQCSHSYSSDPSFPGRTHYRCSQIIASLFTIVHTYERLY